MERVLIIKRDKIGDMLLMTPMLEHLRNSRPDIEINVLANDYNSWILSGNPYVDNLWIYPRSRHDGRFRPMAALSEWLLTIKLVRMNFDYVIAAGGVVSHRAIQRAIRIHGKRTIAFCHPAPGDYRNLISDPVDLPKGLHEVKANLLLLEPVGIAPPECEVWPRYVPPDSCIDGARHWVNGQDLQDGFVIIGINARRSKRKPTDEQILAWAEHIYSRHKLKTVLVWQPGKESSKLYPGDDERISGLLPRLPSYVVPFSAGADIMPLLGVVWHARTTVVPDGGLAHLASVSPGGVLALFAETDISPHPDNWRPFSPKGYFLEADRSVSELHDEEVIEKIDRLIGQPC